MYTEYKITHGNGVTQDKFLVPADDWNNIYKPSMDIVKYKGSVKMPEHITQMVIKEAEANLKKLPPLYFVSNSPLGLAMESGTMILPKTQGGEHHNIIFEKI